MRSSSCSRQPQQLPFLLTDLLYLRRTPLVVLLPQFRFLRRSSRLFWRSSFFRDPYSQPHFATFLNLASSFLAISLLTARTRLFIAISLLFRFRRASSFFHLSSLSSLQRSCASPAAAPCLAVSVRLRLASPGFFQIPLHPLEKSPRRLVARRLGHLHSGCPCTRLHSVRPDVGAVGGRTRLPAQLRGDIPTALGAFLSSPTRRLVPDSHEIPAYWAVDRLSINTPSQLGELTYGEPSARFGCIQERHGTAPRRAATERKAFLTRFPSKSNLLAADRLSINILSQLPELTYAKPSRHGSDV